MVNSTSSISNGDSSILLPCQGIKPESFLQPFTETVDGSNHHGLKIGDYPGGQSNTISVINIANDAIKNDIFTDISAEILIIWEY